MVKLKPQAYRGKLSTVRHHTCCWCSASTLSTVARQQLKYMLLHGLSSMLKWQVCVATDDREIQNDVGWSSPNIYPISGQTMIDDVTEVCA